MALFFVEIGFVGFIVSLFGAVWRGLNKSGQRQRGFAWWLVSAAVCFAIWAIGLRLYPIPFPQ